MPGPTAVDVFFDPVCPFAWLTSRWVLEVAPARDLDVRWRFISLAMVNEGRDYATEFPPAYPVLHGLGRDLLRVAAAARAAGGNEAVGRLYAEAGRRLHVEGLTGALWRGEPVPADLVPSVLQAAGLEAAMAACALDPSLDAVVREETGLALARTGSDVGTPICTFDPGGGGEWSFFGPVLSRVPRADEALAVWDAVCVLAGTRGFAELKRSLRDPLELT